MNLDTAQGNPSSVFYPALEHLGDAVSFIDDILEFVQHIPLLDSFNREEIEILARYMQCYGAPGGVRVLQETDFGDYLLLILTGELIILKRDRDSGEDRRIAVAGPGSTLGEMSLIDGAPRSASCVTVAPTDFAVLTRQSLDEIAHEHPALGHRFMLVLLQILTRRLRHTSNDLLPHAAVVVAI